MHPNNCDAMNSLAFPANVNIHPEVLMWLTIDLDHYNFILNAFNI